MQARVHARGAFMITSRSMTIHMPIACYYDDMFSSFFSPYHHAMLLHCCRFYCCRHMPVVRLDDFYAAAIRFRATPLLPRCRPLTPPCSYTAGSATPIFFATMPEFTTARFSRRLFFFSRYAAIARCRAAQPPLPYYALLSLIIITPMPSPLSPPAAFSPRRLERRERAVAHAQRARCCFQHLRERDRYTLFFFFRYTLSLVRCLPPPYRYIDAAYAIYFFDFAEIISPPSSPISSPIRLLHYADTLAAAPQQKSTRA